jgi:uncharacterized membrane protein YdjX (TVP38/TMEM64 family)
MRTTKIIFVFIFLISVIIIHLFDIKTSFSLYNLDFYKSSHPIASIILFLVLYSIAIIGFVPTLPLNLAAGILWGGIMGGIYSAFGVAIGGAISFLIGRYLFQEKTIFIGKIIKKYGFNIEADISWGFLAILRINPIIPTSVINYVLGCTNIRYYKFIISTLIFIMPASITIAYLGDIFQTVSKEQNIDKILIKIYIISTLIIIIYFLRKYFKNSNYENNPISNDIK